MDYIEFRLTPDEMKEIGFKENPIYLRLILHCFHALGFTWQSYIDESGAINRKKRIYPIETSKIYLPTSCRYNGNQFKGLAGYAAFLSKIKPITTEQVRDLIISLLKSGRYRNRTSRRLTPEAPAMQLDLHIALESDMQRKILWRLDELIMTEYGAVSAPNPFLPVDRVASVPFVWYDETQLATIEPGTFRIQDLR